MCFRFKQTVAALALILAFFGGAAVRAEVLEAKIAQVKTGAGSMRDVRVSLSWPKGAAEGHLRLRAASVELPALAYRVSDVDWQCSLRSASAQAWRCAGNVRAARVGSTGSSRSYPLSFEHSPVATAADLRIGPSRLGYQALASVPERSRIQLERVPVEWLQAFLSELWSEGRWTGAKLDGQIDVLTPAKGPFEVRSDLAVESLDVETPGGLIAAADVKGRLQIDYRQLAQRRSTDARLALRGGEFLAHSLYARFPTATPATLRIVAERQGSAPWRLPQLRFDDPGVLQAQGQVVLDQEALVSDLDLALSIADLGIARDRYLSGFLAPTGFADLLLTGKLDGQFQLRDKSLRQAQARFVDVNAIDTKARFTLSGIDGDLRWTTDSVPLSSRFGWRSGALYGIGLGPARYAFDSADGELQLTAPVAMDVLEGQLRLDHLHWQAPHGQEGAKLQFGMGVAKLDLASLSQRLGWPPFTGRLDGNIPSARYQSSVLRLDGGLQMKLFGGTVDIGDLVMERPLGTAPTLSGDVAIQDIDLEPMTSVFGFGAISGRLDGRIRDLRLFDWSPVAFDARLETDRSWKGKRRISQSAVDDISKVGGAGLAGGLQTKLLKLFKDFGYDRIGIGCKLKDNVCAMDGIGSAGDGYIIVAGAGLPRIQVVGFRRRVDWPTLVSRLKAATEGRAPIIE